MRSIWTVLIATLFTVTVFAEGMEFHHGTWAEALIKSKESGKLIFLDAFTTWCGPCKRMSAQTFPLKEVGEFYNANFINVKIDMEKEEGLVLAGRYSVDSYPTLLYIDGDGKLVMKAIGYMDGPKFIESGKAALKKNDKSDLYAKEYASGKRDYTTVYNYVRSLNQAGKASLKIANEYLNAQKDLSTPENLRFILEAASEVDSRIFDLLIKYKEKLNALVGQDVVHNKILVAATKTAAKAAEFKSADLLATSLDKVKTHLPAQYDVFELDQQLLYYTATHDGEGMLKALKKVPASLEKNIKSMTAAALVIEKNFPQDNKLVSLAETWLSKFNTKEAEVETLFVLARMYALNNKSDKANKLLEEIIPLAKMKKMDTLPMEQFQLKLNKS